MTFPHSQLRRPVPRAHLTRAWTRTSMQCSTFETYSRYHDVCDQAASAHNLVVRQTPVSRFGVVPSSRFEIQRPSVRLLILQGYSVTHEQ